MMNAEPNTAAPGMGELPELPTVKHGLPYTATDYYTADQMHAYAKAALAAQPAPVRAFDFGQHVIWKNDMGDEYPGVICGWKNAPGSEYQVRFASGRISAWTKPDRITATPAQPAPVGDDDSVTYKRGWDAGFAAQPAPVVGGSVNELPAPDAVDYPDSGFRTDAAGLAIWNAHQYDTGGTPYWGADAMHSHGHRKLLAARPGGEDSDGNR